MHLSVSLHAVFSLRPEEAAMLACKNMSVKRKTFCLLRSLDKFQQLLHKLLYFMVNEINMVYLKWPILLTRLLMCDLNILEGLDFVTCTEIGSGLLLHSFKEGFMQVGVLPKFFSITKGC